MIDFPIVAVIADPSFFSMSLLIGPSWEAEKSCGLKTRQSHLFKERRGKRLRFLPISSWFETLHSCLISDRKSSNSRMEPIALQTNVISSSIR